MKALVWTSALVVVTALAGCSYPELIEDGVVDDDYFQEVLAQTAEVSGYRLKTPVPYRVIPQAQVGREIREAIREQEQELSKQAAFLVAFGFAPADVDLARDLAADVQEVALAFYDTRAKRMTFIEREDGGAGFVETILSWWLERDVRNEQVVVHELTHALQDQAHDLTTWEAAAPNGDAQRARLALIEGEAMWFMLRVVARGMMRKKDLAEIEFTRADALAAASAGDRTPGFLRESRLFPYWAGFSFYQRVHRRAREVWKRPPLSTEQVLHPRKYRRNEEPIPLSPMAPLELPAGWSTVDVDVLGELGLQILLSRSGLSPTRVEAAAEGWGADRYAVVRGPGDALGLAWTVYFDTEGDRDEFARAFRRVPRGADQPPWVWKRLGKRGVAVAAGPSSIRDELLAAAARVTPSSPRRIK